MLLMHYFVDGIFHRLRYNQNTIIHSTCIVAASKIGLLTPKQQAQHQQVPERLLKDAMRMSRGIEHVALLDEGRRFGPFYRIEDTATGEIQGEVTAICPAATSHQFA